MRTFIAVEIPNTIKPKISALQKKLVDSGADLRLVGPENLHYNLKFLGEIDDSIVEKIKKALSGISFPSFEVHIAGIGTFPSASYIRVVWLGVKEGKMELVSLASTVEDALIGLNLEREERPFTPHLTLARVGGQKSKEALVKTVKDLEKTDIGTIKINKIILFQSKLSPKGPKYTPLHTVELK